MANARIHTQNGGGESRGKKRRDGRNERETSVGDLSYRKTHRAVHSASAFISFPANPPVHCLPFVHTPYIHIYPPPARIPASRDFYLVTFQAFLLFLYLTTAAATTTLFAAAPFSRAAALFRFLRFFFFFFFSRTSPHYHRFPSLACVCVCVDKGPGIYLTTLVNRTFLTN